MCVCVCARARNRKNTLETRGNVNSSKVDIGYLWSKQHYLLCWKIARKYWFDGHHYSARVCAGNTAFSRGFLPKGCFARSGINLVRGELNNPFRTLPYNVSNLMGVHCTRIPAPPIVVVNQQPGGKEPNFEAQRRGVGENWWLFNLIIILTRIWITLATNFFQHFQTMEI